MRSNPITHYYRHPGLTKSTVENILRNLQRDVSTLIIDVDSELCFNLDLVCPFSSEESEIMKFLLSESYNQKGFGSESFLQTGSPNDLLIEVGPRINIVTAWCTNALSIFRSSNINNVRRIEMSKRYLIKCTGPVDVIAVKNILHDEMTESIYEKPLESFAATSLPEDVQVIDVMEEGETAIERINRAWSLSLSPNEIALITHIFRDELKRNPTDVELMDFIQSNNEHCRHFLMNGKVFLDNQEQPETMMQILKSCSFSSSYPSTLVSFGKDGSAIRGSIAEALNAKEPTYPSPTVLSYQNKNPVCTMTTHNFPSGVTPFPGAETGVGGQIREVISTGNGAKVMGGAAGFLVGNLNMPGYEQPWELTTSYPQLYSKPLTILLEASAGAADYANKFGEPIIAGVTRSFGHVTDDGERSEYIKPVVLSNGIGCCYDSIHIDEQSAAELVIVKIGGPAFRMGLSGGALSSKQQETERFKRHRSTTSSVETNAGDSPDPSRARDRSFRARAQTNDGIKRDIGSNVDFEGVQRGDAEMGNKLCRVISTCVSMGQRNPIVNIFNQGAGGNSHIMKMIVERSESSNRGVKIDLDKIMKGDDSLSAREIWGAEYQENVCVLVKKENVALLQQICNRERIYCMVIGRVTQENRIQVEANGEEVVNLPVDLTYTQIPQHVYHDSLPSGAMESPVEQAMEDGNPPTDLSPYSPYDLSPDLSPFSPTEIPIDSAIDPTMDPTMDSTMDSTIDPTIETTLDPSMDSTLDPAIDSSFPNEFPTSPSPSSPPPPLFLPPFVPPSFSLSDLIDRTLHLLSVGSKSFFVNKFDRSITGLIASQPTCGPLFLPVADVAVIANDYRSQTSGIAFALGEQPVKSLLSIGSMVRLSIGEALTNVVFGNVASFHDIHFLLSFNCAGKLPGETARLYQCCQEVRRTLRELQLELVNVKDSVSMAVRMNEETVKAPLTLVATAFANSEDVSELVTPDLKHAALHSKLLFIDLSTAKSRYSLGGSALAQVFDSLGDETPDVDLKLLKRSFHYVMKLIKRHQILAGHDRSDGGLITAVLEMCFAGDCGVDLEIPAFVDVIGFLFNESLGWILEVDATACEPLLRACKDHDIPAVIIGTTHEERVVRILQNKKTLLCREVISLREEWELTSLQLSKRTYNENFVELEHQARLTMHAPHWDLTYLPSPTKMSLLTKRTKYRVGILREEGTNCDREMVAAFFKSGFEPWLLTMSDFMEQRVDVKQFHGLVFCGGFSFGDVLDSARGWSACILYNKIIRQQFEWFIEQNDRFSLGVCNGCQLMSQINYVPFRIADKARQPRFIQNKAGKLECRFVNVRIEKSKSMFFKGMEGSTLGVWIAHGEGRCYWPDQGVKEEAMAKGCVAMRYVDNEGRPSDDYPFNPNGSENAIAALCSENGHHLSMMPHP